MLSSPIDDSNLLDHDDTTDVLERPSVREAAHLELVSPVSDNLEHGFHPISTHQEGGNDDNEACSSTRSISRSSNSSKSSAMSKSSAKSINGQDPLELSSSSLPSPLQFVLTYEYLREQAEEVEYAQQPTRRKVLSTVIFGILSLVALCGFMVAIVLIGEGVSLLLSCHTKELLSMTDNPIAGVLVGTMATALVHSSSTVASLTVVMVGTNGITLRQGIYIIMGANIGTCVSAEMVALGQARDRTRLERALGGAMVHTMYNIMIVVILMPIELIAHPLEALALALTGTNYAGFDFQNPIKLCVIPLAELLLQVKQKSIYTIAMGDVCEEHDTSLIESGLLSHLPLDDRGIGGVALAIGLLFLVVALLTLVHVFSKVFIGRTKQLLSKVGDWNPYVNILGSTLFTFLASSSSMVTSILTPLVGLNVFTLEQVYPLIIGANLGTTANPLIASFITATPSAVAMALVHFWFNLAGILILYMIPATRKPVLSWSRSFASYGASWLPFAVVFTLGIYYFIPLILFLVLTACRSSTPGHVVLGYLAFMFLAFATVRFIIWYYRKGGQRLWQKFVARKRMHRDVRRYAGQDLALPPFADDSDMYNMGGIMRHHGVSV